MSDVALRPLRIAVLVKQVPKGDQVRLDVGGTLVRDGVELEMNAFCRRAVSKGVELAKASGGTTTVLTLGPDPAEDVLREAIAWGATEGVHLTDRAFAGSDTLATAKALAAALASLGPWDLVLVGRNSIDADTGQVGPALAELMGLPFAGAARQLELDGDELSLVCQADDVSRTAQVSLPAVVAVAERLCDPAKVPPAGREAVDASTIRRIAAADLGSGPWGADGSPTTVTHVREVGVPRAATRLEGAAGEQVQAAMRLLLQRGALTPAPVPAVVHVEDRTPGSRVIAVLDEGNRPQEMRQLLAAAGGLAAEADGIVIAVVPGPADSDYTRTLSTWGADEVVQLDGAAVAEDVAAGFVQWARRAGPWAVISASTGWGREVSSRAAAALHAGLTGDAIAVEVDHAPGPSAPRLVAWKPSFAARFDAAIVASTPCQMVTLRPGAIPAGPTRAPRDIPVTRERVAPRSRLRVLSEHREDDLSALATADRVVGVGQGVDPAEYELLQPLLGVLAAELAATRKVTDRGWLPLSRQLGITGRMIAPVLYIAIGIGGSPNHTAGIRRAATVLAINSDPAAAIFDDADIGIVADWREVVPLLAAELSGSAALLPAMLP